MHNSQQTKILIRNLNTNFQVIDFEYKYQFKIFFTIFSSLWIMCWNACQLIDSLFLAYINLIFKFNVWFIWAGKIYNLTWSKNIDGDGWHLIPFGIHWSTCVICIKLGYLNSWFCDSHPGMSKITLNPYVA